MSQETVLVFVESWTTCWTLVLGLGYLGQTLPFPALKVLGREATQHAMLAASLAVVLGLCFAGYPPAGLTVSGWAIGLSLVRRIVTSPE